MITIHSWSHGTNVSIDAGAGNTRFLNTDGTATLTKEFEEIVATIVFDGGVPATDEIFSSEVY